MRKWRGLNIRGYGPVAADVSTRKYLPLRRWVERRVWLRQLDYFPSIKVARTDVRGYDLATTRWHVLAHHETLGLTISEEAVNGCRYFARVGEPAVAISSE